MLSLSVARLVSLSVAGGGRPPFFTSGVPYIWQEEANSYFQRIYSGTVEIENVIAMLKR